MRHSTNFASTGVSTILKSYFSLTNSDILKEKDSYYLTYRHDRHYEPEHIDDYRLELNPKISVYRYLCELIDGPSLMMQTAIDSYLKTFEAMATASNNNGPGNHNPILSIEATENQENWGRRFLTHLEETTPFGLTINILEDSKFQCPGAVYNIDYNRKNYNGTVQPVFGFMMFSIDNTHTSYDYSWRNRRTSLSGPGANSPFANHDGTYLLLSFPHPRPEEHNSNRYQNYNESAGNSKPWQQEHRGYHESKRRPFYANHVCFKVKDKHNHYIDDAENPIIHCDSFVSQRYQRNSADRRIGTSRLDVYAETPLGYDDNLNAQMSLLGDRGRPLGSGNCLWNSNVGSIDHRRRTFIRWSSYTSDVTNSSDSAHLDKINWAFSGRYYDGDSKLQLNCKDIPDLNAFEITKDEKYIGKGKIYADEDKILYCPLTGYPLRCCATVSNTHRKIQEYQSNRSYWH